MCAGLACEVRAQKSRVFFEQVQESTPGNFRKGLEIQEYPRVRGKRPLKIPMYCTKRRHYSAFAKQWQAGV